MGQLVGCIRGIGEACQRARLPGRVRQRVALQRDERPGHPADADDRRASASSTTWRSMPRSPFKREEDAIVLIGATEGWLGQSIYLREICGREEGAPPPVDLAAEKRNGDFVRQLIRSGQVDTVHDVLGRRHRRWRSPRWRWRAASARMLTAAPDGHPAPRLPVRRGPGPLRHRLRCRPGGRHPLRGQRGRRAGRDARPHRRRFVDSSGPRGHIGGGAEGRARALAAGLHGRQGRLRSDECRCRWTPREIESLIKAAIPDAAGRDQGSRRRRRPLRRDRHLRGLQGQVARAAAPDGLFGAAGPHGRRAARPCADDRRPRQLNRKPGALTAADQEQP